MANKKVHVAIREQLEKIWQEYPCQNPLKKKKWDFVNLFQPRKMP